MAEADPKHLNNKRLASNDNEIEDTASSKPKVEKLEITNRGIGNQRGWLKKMEEVKTKFNTESAPMEDVDKHEFELWMKIWGE
ncbi:hypothetical protein L2E82_04289 [Cichorium intybus]|uniref:Uncharacterized protein n=1 Tax=Cichorium intybus TaxID=13427 RepID=A0ACB9H7F6_CICIN|nr:hypothetical protein L2E82_04289 [Cichorium intybus]